MFSPQSIYFPLAKIIGLRLRPAGASAAFVAPLPPKVAEELGWTMPDEFDAAVRKTTWLKGTRLLMKQNREEIGDLEVDVEIESVSRFVILQMPDKHGRIRTRVKFVVSFPAKCVDAAANLEKMIRFTVKPCSLRLFLEKEPEQTTIEDVKTDPEAMQRVLEETTA